LVKNIGIEVGEGSRIKYFNREKGEANIGKLAIIWYFFRPYKVQLGILLFVMFFSGLMEMLNLAVLYPIINFGLDLQNDTFILRSFDKVVNLFANDNPFFVSCVILMIITLIATAFKIFYTYFSHKLMIKIVGDTQKKIFSKYLTADYSFFTQNQQGKLIHTGTIAPDHVLNIVLSTIRFTYDSLNSILLFSLLLAIAWQGTMALILIGLIYTMLIKRVLEKVIYKCAVISNDEDRKKNVILNEFINGVKAIRIFFTLSGWKKKYESVVDKKLFNQLKMLVARVIPECSTRFIFFVLLAGVGMYLSQQSRGALIAAIPLFGSFAVVANRFLPSIQVVGNDVMSIAHSVPNTKIVYNLLVSKIKTISDGEKVLKLFDKEIAFERVWFRYENMREYLLKDVSFEIKKKKVTAVVGPSGSGKTTIVNLLLKLYQADKGKIKIDGTDISDYTNESFLKKIGYVSQETFIFNDTIRENIRFGMENCSDELIFEAAKLAHAHDFIMNMQGGYDAVVGDAGVKLSGGQRQRLAIARAMLRKPEILVLDEATSSLDNIAEKNVQQAINQVSQHTTVLVIAHRLSTVERADKIVVLENGFVREQGDHNALMAQKGLYFNLYTKEGWEGEMVTLLSK